MSTLSQRRLAALLFAAATAFGQEPAVRLTRVAGGFTAVVDIQSARDGSGRLFLAQQNGVIRVIENGAARAEPFLDISSRTLRNGECGLLGIAFPPGFAGKGHFYVDYTDRTCQNSIVARYRLVDNNTADPGSEEVLLRQAQPFRNHNGGQLQFGPDGFLYVGFGDGGSAGDPGDRAQDRQSLLGKLLRIDPETPAGGAAYAIPVSNPFAGNPAYRPEIWALGLRNPWRFSFDRETGDLWIGDVGQDRAEEVNYHPAAAAAGENFGWRLMEGLQCFNPRTNCDRTGLTPPVHEYTRERGDVSITGGYVYRGRRSPELLGAYIYADYATGRMWAMRREGTGFVNRPLHEAGFQVSTFGQDEAGEIYVSNFGGGVVYRIETLSAPESPRISSGGVVNAASFEPGIVAGSLFTVFGTGFTNGPGVTAARGLPLPTSLGGVAVAIDGRAAPLVAVANVDGREQINAQAPFDLTGSDLNVTVTRDGVASAAAAVRRLDAQPAIFGGIGGAIVVHSEGNELVSTARPLRREEFAYFYASGLGPVENAPAAGAGGPSDPLARVRGAVIVTIDGVPCEVSYVGLAPGFAGVYQVNVRVAGGVGTGLKDLTIAVGGVPSAAVKVPVE
ncbi:MAG: PQQ-dependent sugar dehydrogenase [Bryobacteraceae bacterium]